MLVCDRPGCLTPSDSARPLTLTYLRGVAVVPCLMVKFYKESNRLLQSAGNGANLCPEGVESFCIRSFGPYLACSGRKAIRKTSCSNHTNFRRSTQSPGHSLLKQVPGHHPAGCAHSARCRVAISAYILLPKMGPNKITNIRTYFQTFTCART